jgi:DNA-directed RNA polymerase specialized sigma24 family protein
MPISMADTDDDEPLAHPHHPRVLAVVRAVLLDNRWPKHDLEIGVSEVELRAWASRKERPATVGAWKALCREVARNMAIDRVRSEKVGGKEATEPTDRLDEREAANSGDTMDAAIDRQRALAEMAAVVPAEDRPVFDRWALGLSQKEIARELSVHPREVSRKVTSLRKRFSTRYSAAAVGALLAAAVGAYFVFRDKLGPDDQAHNQTPSPSSAPSAPPGPSPEQLARRAKADDLRKLASAECADGHWTTCNKDLDQASDVDPQGEQARRVKRLRNEVMRGEIQDEIESKKTSMSRALRPDQKAKVVAALAASRGQALRLVCAPGPEPSHFCDQLAAAMTSAGWVVTRTNVAADAGLPYGLVIDVATDADEATQDAADTLAAGLQKGFLLARGPRDMATGGDAPLRLTVGPP